MKFPNKKQWAWIGGIAAAALAIISDLGGAYSILNGALGKLLAIKVSVLWLLVLVPVTIFISYKIARKIGRHPSNVLSLDNAGQFYQKIQEQLISARREVILVGLEKDWVFPLFVSVAIARLRNVAVSVAYFQEFHERYQLLQLLGCEVVKGKAETERDLFVGVLSDPNDVLNCRATIRTARSSEAIYGRHYFACLDYHVISASRSHLRTVLGFANNAAALPDGSVRHQPTLVEVSDEDIVSRLRAVKFYDRAQIHVQDVQIVDTHPVSSFVVRYKLNQALELIRLYEDKGWKLFRLSGIRLGNGKISLFIPPVIEEHNGRLYVVEGHSRLFALQEKGHKTVRAVVVRDVLAGLPMNPITWRKVLVVDEKKEKRDLQLARYIETAAHVGVWGGEAGR